MTFKSLKKQFSRGRLSFWESRDGLIHARRDWLIMFLLSLVAFVGVIFFSFFLFLEINKGDLYVVAAGSGQRIETIDRTLLAETLDSFEIKARRFSELTEHPPSIPSP